MKLDASDIADLRPLIVEAVRVTVQELAAAGRLGTPRPPSGDEPPPRLLTVKQAGAVLGCCGRTISLMIARGELAGVRIGTGGGGVRVDRIDLDAWIAAEIRKRLDGGGHSMTRPGITKRPSGANGKPASKPAAPLPPEILDRQPPNNLDAERGVLGSILLNPEICDEVAERVRSVDFYDDANLRLFKHLVAIHKSGQRIDSTLLVNQLKAAGDFEAIGGAAYLAEVVRSVPHAANARHYAGIVREASANRQLIHLASDVLRGAYDGRPSSDLIGLISQAASGLATEIAGPKYRRFTAAELDQADFQIEYLIEHCLVAGQPAIIAGGKKSLKTNLSMDLAISLVTGQPFLGQLRVNRAVRVAIMSGESGIATVKETARRICAAKGFELPDAEGLIFSPDLPNLSDPSYAPALRRFLTDDKAEVLIADPAYMMMPGADAGNLFIQGAMLRALCDVCGAAGASLILVHHTRMRPGVYDPPELDDIAWAGFQEFARQWLLLGRRERYEPGSGMHRLWLNCGGSAGHSAMWALDVDEGAYDGRMPRKWKAALQKADDARSEAEERRASDKEQRQRRADEIKLESTKRKLWDAMATFPAGETKREIEITAGVSGATSRDAFSAMLRDGKIESCDVQKSNRRTPYPGFRIKPE